MRKIFQQPHQGLGLARTRYCLERQEIGARVGKHFQSWSVEVQEPAGREAVIAAVLGPIREIRTVRSNRRRNEGKGASLAVVGVVPEALTRVARQLHT